MRGSEDVLDWGALVSRFVHPTKVWIIEAMRWIDRPLSASDLEKVLAGAKDLSAISYHVNSLAKAGALERVKKRQVRGTRESHFSVTKTVRAQRQS